MKRTLILMVIVFVPLGPPGLAELPLDRNYRDLFVNFAVVP
jgi:hypothetical protein